MRPSPAQKLAQEWTTDSKPLGHLFSGRAPIQFSHQKLPNRVIVKITVAHWAFYHYICRSQPKEPVRWKR